jgi:CRISPR-associated protein Csb2
VIGDGRFCGLGLMKSVGTTGGVFAFSIESGLNANPDPIRLSRALRRAVMARTRDVLRTYRLPTYFSEHREDGAPGRSEHEPHLAFLFDSLEKQLLVITPEHLDRRTRWSNEKNLAALESALQHFHELRAGADGHLRIRPISLDLDRHRLFAPSQVWESITPYQVNRHAKKSNAEEVLKKDVIAACEHRGFPRPEISVLNWTVHQGTGLQGILRLTFKHAIQGPIMLGRTRYIGGGVFYGVDWNAA